MLQKGPSISHFFSRNHSDDSNSEDSDYEDNIPLQITKKDLIQCLGSPLFVEEQELKNVYTKCK